MIRTLVYLVVVFMAALQPVNLCAQDAPVVVIGSVEITGSSGSVSVTAGSFINTGSCNLQMLYDPEITLCSSVIKGTLLPGNLAFNINVAGVITLGWYTWPGVTLPDGTEIFILNFSKVTQGTSAITWNENYPDRQWSDGNSFTLNDLPFGSFYFSGSITFQEDAPVTTLPVLNSCSGLPVDLPVMVGNFNTIGAISLTIHYDPEVISYQSYTNNSGYPGLFVNDPAPGIITAAGFATVSGITLPDNAVLFTMHFLSLDGSSEISWFDDGASCEYAGPPPTYIVLNDIPLSEFYHDGWLTISMAPAIISQPISPDPVIEGSGTAVFSVGASGEGLGYQWQEFISSWSDLSDGGVYSGCLLADLTLTNPSLNMNGNKYRCIVTGNCEPQAITDGNAILTVIESTGLTEFNTSNRNDFNMICSPNPFRHETRISFTLPFSGFLTLELTDPFGMKAQELAKGYSSEGSYIFDFGRNQTGPGLYFLRVHLISESGILKGITKIICLE